MKNNDAPRLVKTITTLPQLPEGWRWVSSNDQWWLAVAPELAKAFDWLAETAGRGPMGTPRANSKVCDPETKEWMLYLPEGISLATIQDLFSGACPELTWAIVGDYVVAQELPLETIRVFWGPAPTAAMWPKANMLRILRCDGGIHTLHPDDMRIAESVAMIVDAVLGKNTPAHEYLGVRRLRARVRAQAQRELIRYLEELLTQRTDELERATAKQRHAQAAVRKATRVVHGLRKDIKKEQAKLAEAEAEAARLAAKTAE